MEALAKLTDLYQRRDDLNQQIQAISDLLGVKEESKEKKERKARGPNKKKEAPFEPPKLAETPKPRMTAPTLS